MPMNESFPLALPQGTVLAGQYMIEKVLGQGGFGITYRAVDYVTKQKVAVKEYFPDTLAYREMTVVISYPGERSENYAYGKENFLQEARTLAEFIGNEGIVRIHSYFEENGTAYFVMDYIEGQSFDDYLKENGGKIDVEEAKRILFPVMDALESVHNKGIVHRDVTPDNIYITNDNKVKLLDFGAARYSLGDKSRSLDVILKHGFAPKEQYTRRGKQGPFTDVYSLAATFYFAITGKRPPDSVERLDEDELVPPKNLGVQITDYQEKALLLALNVQPADRFQSMLAFKKALLDEKSAVNQIFFNAPEVSVTPVAQQTSSAAQQERYLQQNMQPQLIAGQPETTESKKRNQKIFVAGGVAAATVVLLVGAFVLIRGILSDSRKKEASLTYHEQEQPIDDTTENVYPEGMYPEDVYPEGMYPENVYPEDMYPEEENLEESPAYQKQELVVVGNTPANIKNMGVYTKNGDKEFWIDENYHSVISSDGYVFQDRSGTFSCLSYYDGMLYFLYDGSAYRKGRTTEEIPELAAYAGNIERLYVTTGCYFFSTTDDVLYRVSRKTREVEDEIAVSSPYDFTFADGWLYYIGRDSDGNSAIRRTKADDFNSVDDQYIYNKNGYYSEPVVKGDYIYVVWKNNEGAVEIVRYNLALDDGNGCIWNVSSYVKNPKYYLECNVVEENIFFKAVEVDETETSDNSILYCIIAGSGYGSEYECVVVDTRRAMYVNVGENAVYYMANREEDGKMVLFYSEF